VNSVDTLLPSISEDDLIFYVRNQRWFASKSREVAHATIVDTAPIRREAPFLVLALLEVRFDTGTHETYQVLLGLRPVSDGWADAITRLDGWDVYGALSDPQLARELVHLVRASATERAGEGTVEFRPLEGFAGLGRELVTARRITSEQSNSSVVFDDELILKCFRRLEAGINPELELVRFLTERGFRNVPELGGWYAYRGAPMEATLGILQRYVPEGRDGWELALDEIETAPDRLLGRLHRLGEVTGGMHRLLGSDASDPAFAPEEPSAESLGLLTASVDQEIESVFLDLPEDGAVAPIVGRGEEVRERLRQLTYAESLGRLIRHHGDFHLGQTLWAGEDLYILDFEGEPARSLLERRQKRSPLRDVAGMLRSISYAVSASELVRGVRPPDGWEEQARGEFLESYLQSVDPGMLPPSRDSVDRLIEVFELEKAVYELRYDLNNRPDWVGIPVDGILRLLEQPLGE
jgi:trehalose synthase-fused probable maltokinase